MTNTTPTRPPFKDTAVFGSLADAHRQCCQCCNGYCPAQENEDELLPEQLWRMVIGGVDYITDRYVMLRADLIAMQGDPLLIDILLDWEAPAIKPGPSTQPLEPSRMCRMITLGIEICEGGPGVRQPLYLSEEHIGWVMVARPTGRYSAFTVGDREELARIATDLPVIENAHPWTTAARLLIWERERQAERAAKGA